MDIIVSDIDFKVMDLIESYDSLIWTERYNRMGDFTLEMPWDDYNSGVIKNAMHLQIPTSGRSMLVEDVEEGETVKITGRSLEGLLDQRIIETSGRDIPPGIPGLISNLVHYNAGAKCDPATRQIPYLWIAPNTIDGYKDPALGYEPVQYGENLYTAVTRLCDAGDLGFKLVNQGKRNILSFSVYYGVDRTKSNPVIFSESMGNIEGVSRFQSKSTLRNVAVVNLPPWDDTPGIGELWRVSKGKEPTGRDRREVWTDASELRQDESFTASNKPSRAKAWGQIELLGHKAIDAIDFKMADDNPYEYDVDYFLGDIVTVIDRSGRKASHRVTEYIQSFGPTGSSEYPTLTAL